VDFSISWVGEAIAIKCIVATAGERLQSPYGYHRRIEDAAQSMTDLSQESIVAAVPDQVSCDLGGEAAILNVANGVYYGLDPVGALIWNLIQKPQRVTEIRDNILREYDVQPAECERDLISLLNKLLAEGLIEIRDGAGA